MMSPLEGVRVLDVTNWMAGPSAGAILADMGADVVKVEPLGGDVVRGHARQPKKGAGIPEVDASFEADNRGKRSIAIALDKPEGAALVRRLVAEFDVFLCNLLPKRQVRFGLDPESLLAVNAQLVHVSFSGYGQHGPDADRPGFDVTAFFGRGSLTDSMREPDRAPPAARPAQGDHTSALALVAGVLAALRVTERTGVGQVVDCNLLATAAWSVTTDLAVALVDGHLPSKRDRRHLLNPLTNKYRCRDDRWIIVNMTETRYWPTFCEVVGQSEWVDHPRYLTAKQRMSNIAEMTDLLDDIIVTRTMSEWGQLFDAAGLIWAPAASLTELALDPQAEVIGMYPVIDHPNGPFRTVAAPMFFRNADVRPRGRAPSVGEHTEAILLGTGLGAHDVAALVAAGVVGVAAQR